MPYRATAHLHGQAPATRKCLDIRRYHSHCKLYQPRHSAQSRKCTWSNRLSQYAPTQQEPLHPPLQKSATARYRRASTSTRRRRPGITRKSRELSIVLTLNVLHGMHRADLRRIFSSKENSSTSRTSAPGNEFRVKKGARNYLRNSTHPMFSYSELSQRTTYIHEHCPTD